MEAYQVILLVLLIVFLLYLSLALYAISRVLSTYSSIRKRQRGLYLLFGLKRERMAELLEEVSNCGIDVSEVDKETFDRLNKLPLKSNKESDLFEASSLTKLAYARLLSYLHRDEFKTGRKTESRILALQDANSFYHSSCALYNGDVGRYNYYLSIPLCRWIPFIFGFRKRKNIA